MKKMLSAIVLVILCFSLSACGTSEKDNSKNITIDDVTAAIQSVDSSFAFDENKPFFEMIGAKDGWIGYVNDTTVVKVYQFDDSSYKKAVDSYGEMLSEMPKVGDFVLECKNEDVKNAFENID